MTGTSCKKILLVSETSVYNLNGVSKTLRKLLDHYDTGKTKAVDLPNSNITIFGPDFANKLHPDNDHIKFVGTLGIPLFFYPEIKFNFLLIHMIYLLATENYDIVHLVDPNLLGPQVLYFLVLGKWLGWFKNTEIVSSYHTNIEMYAEMYGFGYLCKPINWLIKQYHAHSQTVFIPSESIKTQLVENNGFDESKLVIWSRGIDLNIQTDHQQIRTSNIQYWVDDSKFNILYVGRISKDKNLTLLVNIINSLSPSFRQKFNFYIVGNGPFLSTMKQLLHEYVNKSVFFTGYLTGLDLTYYYRNCSLFIFPSYTETFGQVVLEALSHGVPVLGISSLGVNDLVKSGYNGLLHSTNSENQTGADNSGPEMVSQFIKSIEYFHDLYQNRYVLDFDGTESMQVSPTLSATTLTPTSSSSSLNSLASACTLSGMIINDKHQNNIENMSYEHYRANALDFSKQFSWENSLNVVFSTYSKIFKPKKLGKNKNFIKNGLYFDQARVGYQETDLLIRPYDGNSQTISRYN